MGCKKLSILAQETNHLGNVLSVVSDRRDRESSSGVIAYDPVILSATDYYPFGMDMPGRSISSNSYRFGFNDERSALSERKRMSGGHLAERTAKRLERTIIGEWGSQTHYDYGFRIYNPGIGKFLSVDPLTKEYPMLTPYQFASNSPIDGIDLDGLEYVRYAVFLNSNHEFIKKVVIKDFRNMTANQIKEVHGMSEKDFYQKYSQSFGPSGRNVESQYFVQNSTGGFDARTPKGNFQEFDQISDGDWFASVKQIKDRIGRNGFYTGSGSVSKMGGSFVAGSSSNPYDYSLTPINIVDQFALIHDKSQANVIGNYGYQMVGYLGPLEDVRDKIFEGDKTLLSQFSSLKEGQIDPITNRQLSEEAWETATNGKTLFSMIVRYKKWKRSQLSNPNNSKEAGEITIDDWDDPAAKVLKVVFPKDQ